MELSELLNMLYFYAKKLDFYKGQENNYRIYKQAIFEFKELNFKLKEISKADLNTNLQIFKYNTYLKVKFLLNKIECKDTIKEKIFHYFNKYW